MNMGLAIFKRAQRLQGGTEAVPEELPTPLDVPDTRGDRARRYLFDQVRQGVLPDEALSEIKRDPTSMRAMLAYGEAALAAGTLLSGGEGLPRGEKIGPVFHGTKGEVQPKMFDTMLTPAGTNDTPGAYFTNDSSVAKSYGYVRSGGQHENVGEYQLSLKNPATREAETEAMYLADDQTAPVQKGVTERGRRREIGPRKASSRCRSEEAT